ncbi:MAG TPA: thioredoxin domain-containing protein [Vicinamibacteria bacterium]|nr:thioredoxin domain-containing protein [Vicinamibacteria bacterium]
MKQKAVVSPAPATAQPSARSVAALVALGLVGALLSVFLWLQLVLARSGGPSVCGPEDGGACGLLWDGGFARSVQETTGLPVAAWGLVWALVAFTLPLLELLRQADRGASPGLLAGIRWTAAAGAGAAVGLATASLTAGALCAGCLAMQLTAAAYGAIALFAWRGLPFADTGRGAALAGGLALSAALLLLYPGQHTPAARAGAETLARAVEATAGTRTGPAASGGDPSRAAGTGDPALDQQLQEFVASLQPEARQTLSDSLAVYRAAAPAPPARTRALVGPTSAPVRITEFTDVRCPHCADLHETLKYLRQNTPGAAFQVEARQFPLDGACNPAVRQRGDDPVRCLAAKAQICLEGHPGAFDYAGALFARHSSLTAEQVYSLAGPYQPRADLQACVASAETQAKVEEDVREATRHDFDGTPLVLVNGRKGSSFGPFLYAMILTEGRADHPAFATLPAANPHAHVH